MFSAILCRFCDSCRCAVILCICSLWTVILCPYFDSWCCFVSSPICSLCSAILCSWCDNCDCINWSFIHRWMFSISCLLQDLYWFAVSSSICTLYCTILPRCSHWWPCSCSDAGLSLKFHNALECLLCLTLPALTLLSLILRLCFSPLTSRCAGVSRSLAAFF